MARTPKVNGKLTAKRKLPKPLAEFERRSGFDRRQGRERRKLDIPVAVERRSGKERRSPMERRQCPLA